MIATDALAGEAKRLAPTLTELRHAIHRRPEIGLDLPETQAAIVRALDGLGLEITLGRSLSSVTAVLRGRRHGHAVLLRGDMDALPLDERSGVPYASEIGGAMHACGHDMHSTMLVGAAHLLAACRDDLDGDVIFMFQPGEEFGTGAELMIDEGVLDAAGSPVIAAYAMHVRASRNRRGLFLSRPGVAMGNSDTLTVTLRGPGGTASSPHLTRDPVVAASELILALQAMVTRRFNVWDPVLVTVGTIHGGTKVNVMPHSVTFEANVRSWSAASQDRVEAESVQLCRDLAGAHGLEIDVDYAKCFPMTLNDPERTAFVRALIEEVFGAERYAEHPHAQPSSEDFSHVLRQVPGCYVILGACPHDDVANAAGNHSPWAAYSDDVLTDGALLHAHLALRTLAGSGADART